MDEQSLTAGIFGLATRRMCGDASRLASRWALTPPFHPYRRPKPAAVVFCHIIPGIAAGFPLKNAVLCVARTFLYASEAERQTVPLLMSLCPAMPNRVAKLLN